jgi:diphosphomevalonate decarboxylase
MPMKFVTCIAPVNIAVIKYWGKRDEELILPLNDSLSGTLSTDQMCSKTTVAIDPSFQKDRMWLNGKEETFDNQRLRNCLTEIKARARSQGNLTSEELSWHVHICSENNFPTAAGLASSAAGYACLVYSLGQLYGIKGDISGIARQGSGSACRSVDGGFVQWVAGTAADGSDSIAKQIVDEKHWPEMRVLILVVSDNKKKTSSTSGMQNSCVTSELLKHRVAKCVPDSMAKITKAILERDYQTFAEITMRDSNQFHAVCLDTYPPCVYMNDVSHAIADLVHQINKDAGKNIVSYTYDAGPNACLYLLDEFVPTVLAAVNHAFPTNLPQNEYLKGMPSKIEPLSKNLPTVAKREPYSMNALRYIIHTKIGEGPKNVSATENLLNSQGLPKN